MDLTPRTSLQLAEAVASSRPTKPILARPKNRMSPPNAWGPIRLLLDVLITFKGCHDSLTVSVRSESYRRRFSKNRAAFATLVPYRTYYRKLFEKIASPHGGRSGPYCVSSYVRPATAKNRTVE